MRGDYIYLTTISHQALYLSFSYLTTTDNYYIMIAQIEKYREIRHISCCSFNFSGILSFI